MNVAHRKVREVVECMTGKQEEKIADAIRETLGVSSLPPVRCHRHHRSHAASAFYPSGFDEALVVTIDSAGEDDSTVVWHASESGLEKLRTYDFPNSLGFFFSGITEFLGYRFNNGEGKVMGLAPYGDRNEEIEETLRSLVTPGVDYDVTELTQYGPREMEHVLGDLFDRDPLDRGGEYDDWHQDLAYAAQQFLEETVEAIVREYLPEVSTDNVALAGGVALNCKMNKRVMEMDEVDSVFVQPVANDPGSALGSALLEFEPGEVPQMRNVYWGPEYSGETVRDVLERNKLDYDTPENLSREVAEALADGQLVGWYQNRMEMGPRALGNRSILADPRSKSSLDRVNEYVKHREEWRPFAPSMLAEAADDYLEGVDSAPFMIKTFDPVDDRKDEIEAVLHPADDTTRPQLVYEDQNPEYYDLISAFEDLTGVPVLLNTSFNDNGEPIVNRVEEAVRAFYTMGLDMLVLDDVVIRK
ncbi:carbamoyltransferase [Halorussus caseinilyticus]|uniref:Carbamoyltransferase n=2 Tax=Halorussus caseinilyticus TaxID=3034025 RepID=A0ABD5WMU0_9EURY